MEGVEFSMSSTQILSSCAVYLPGFPRNGLLEALTQTARRQTTCTNSQLGSLHLRGSQGLSHCHKLSIGERTRLPLWVTPSPAAADSWRTVISGSLDVLSCPKHTPVHAVTQPPKSQPTATWPPTPACSLRVTASLLLPFPVPFVT